MVHLLRLAAMDTVLWTMMRIRIWDLLVLRLLLVMMGTPSPRPCWERWFSKCSRDCFGMLSLLRSLLLRVLGHLFLLDPVHLDRGPLGLCLVARNIHARCSPGLLAHVRRVRLAVSRHTRLLHIGSLFVSQRGDPPFPRPTPCELEHLASAAGSSPSPPPSQFLPLLLHSSSGPLEPLFSESWPHLLQLSGAPPPGGHCSI